VVANKGATSTELPTTIPTQYSDQTGTVRFTRVDKTKGGASSFPTKSFDGAYQHNVINGNVTQRLVEFIRLICVGKRKKEN
jgi:hypothetical protein